MYLRRCVLWLCRKQQLLPPLLLPQVILQIFLFMSMRILLYTRYVVVATIVFVLAQHLLSGVILYFFTTTISQTNEPVMRGVRGAERQAKNQPYDFFSFHR